MSRRSALDPKFPFLLLPGRGGFGVPLATPWGECAASESETAVGLGTLRPSQCCQWGQGQPAEISLPGGTGSHRQILPACWAAVSEHSSHPAPPSTPKSAASGHTIRFRACWKAPRGSSEQETELWALQNPRLGKSLSAPGGCEQVKNWRGEGWRAGAREDPSCLSSWWRQNSHQNETNPSFFPSPFLFGAFVRTAKT